MAGAEGERTGQKPNELGRTHLARRHRELAVMDRATTADVAIDRHVVRRIAEDQRGFLSIHQDSVCALIQRAAAIDAMRAEYPEVACAADGRARLCDGNRVGIVVS